MENTLYQVKGTQTFVTYLATNAKGEWVVEEKGGGKPMAIAKDQLEEVIPWSFSVKFAFDGQSYHYQGKEGSVEVGDVLFVEENQKLVVVTGVDTKSRKATRVFKGIKFEGTKLE